VKQHAKAVYMALGVRSRVQAGRAAQQRGIKLD
jgi:DNA-binding NarL/FixJ family response regulator